MISFLIPNYNGELFIRDCLNSILQQTYTNWEALVIDDSSLDNSVNIIKEYKDERIKLVQRDIHVGLPNILNIGLNICKGEYIARLDSDDIAEPDRLKIQIDYLTDNQNVGILGTARRIIGTDKVYNSPVSEKVGKARIFFENFIAHPTVIMRKNVLEHYQLNYDPVFLYSQDYDLWLRASLVTGIASISNVLVQYREHQGQTSKDKIIIQTQYAQKARKRAFLLAGFRLNERFLQLLEKVSAYKGILKKVERREVIQLRDFLIVENKTIGFCDIKIWNDTVEEFCGNVLYE